MTGLREVEGGFSRSAIGWIVGVGVASFVLALLLSAFGEDLFERPTADANSFSRSALGHRALAELLQSLGIGVVSRRTPGTGTPGLVRPVIAAEPDPEAERLPELVKEASYSQAPLVVVLPKWRGMPHVKNPGWIGAAELLGEDRVRLVLENLGAEGLEKTGIDRGDRGDRSDRSEGPHVHGCSAGWRSAASAGIIDYRVDLAPAQLLAPGPGLEPEVTCGKGLLIARHKHGPGKPEIYVISDPDLLNNHGLGDGDNAVLIYDFLTHRLGAKGVILDETIHGFQRTPGLLAEAFRFPLLLAVLQSLVLTGVLLWAGMSRFGKPVPPPAGLGNGRQVLIDSTARLLTYGGHGAESVARYFHQTLRALASGLGLSSDAPDSEVLERLQRISRERRLGMDLYTLQEQVKHPPGGEVATDWALSIAQDIYRWRQEMTDGNRTRS
jgi:hypothetical protein